MHTSRSQSTSGSVFTAQQRPLSTNMPSGLPEEAVADHSLARRELYRTGGRAKHRRLHKRCVEAFRLQRVRLLTSDRTLPESTGGCDWRKTPSTRAPGNSRAPPVLCGPLFRRPRAAPCSPGKSLRSFVREPRLPQPIMRACMSAGDLDVCGRGSISIWIVKTVRIFLSSRGCCRRTGAGARLLLVWRADRSSAGATTSTWWLGRPARARDNGCAVHRSWAVDRGLRRPNDLIIVLPDKPLLVYDEATGPVRRRRSGVRCQA